MSPQADEPTPLSNLERIAALEVRQRRDRTRFSFLYGLAFIALVITGAGYSELQDVATTNRALIREAEANDRQQVRSNIARCAAISAVIQSGRRAILDGREPGDADYSTRKTAADRYSSFIATEVELVTGNPFVVNRDGSLNCPALSPGSPMTPKATRELPPRPKDPAP